MTKFVEFCIDTITDDATLSHQLWWVVLYLASYTIAQLLAKTQALSHPFQGFVVCMQTSVLDGFDGLQRYLHLHHLTR